MQAQIIALGTWLLIVTPTTCPPTWSVEFEQYGRYDLCHLQAIEYKKRLPQYDYECRQIRKQEV